MAKSKGSTIARLTRDQVAEAWWRRGKHWLPWECPAKYAYMGIRCDGPKVPVEGIAGGVRMCAAHRAARVAR